MVGLVGGIYATGDSPAEIRELTEQIDWNDVIRGQITFHSSLLPPQGGRRRISQLPRIRFKEGLSVPRGLQFRVSGGLVFGPHRSSLFGNAELRRSAHSICLCRYGSRFRQAARLSRWLPGASTALNHASLPGIFSPIRTSNAIYVDGGLLDNLPVDVAKDMGADLVIAIQLQNRDLKPTESLSSVGVLAQSISVMVAANELRSMQNADILISGAAHRLHGHGLLERKRPHSEGNQAAASKATVLSAFSVDDAAWREYMQQRQSRRREAPSPAFVERWSLLASIRRLQRKWNMDFPPTWESLWTRPLSIVNSPS